MAKRALIIKEAYNEALTVGEFILMIEDLKNFIRLTAKGMERRLSDEINKIGGRMNDHKTIVATPGTSRL